MEINWVAISFVMLAGLATGLGAIPIYFKQTFSKVSLDVGLGFSAGIMLVASFVALIIPGLVEAERVYPSSLSMWIVMLSLLVGYVFIILIHDILPHEHLIKKTDMQHKKNLSRTSLIVLAIALHNIPEGLAVGVGFGTGDTSSGIALAIAIAIQNMPEGLVVAIGLLREGVSKHKAFLLALSTGLVEPVAAALGYFTATLSSYSLPIALGFAGGTMLFVICQEIFPELFRQGSEKRATLGVISGIIVMFVIEHYLG